MKQEITKQRSKKLCNKKCRNLVITLCLNICFLNVVFAGISKTHKKYPQRQSPLIGTTVIDTINYFDFNKKSEKNNIYKEKGKKSYEAYASYYHRGGKKTANGDSFQPYSQLTCAASHKFPFGTRLKVTNIANMKSVIVTVTDRGSFYKKRGHEYDLDLTHLAFSKLADHSQGRIKINYEVLN